MSQLFLFVLASCGFTYIMTDSTIMAPLRDFLEAKLPAKVYEVFTCHQCMGFWTGVLCALAILDCTFLTGLMGGFAGSFVSLFFGRIAACLRELADCLLHKSLYYESQTILSLEEDKNES